MDTNKPNEIDEIFRDSLQSYLDGPSDAVWGKIENQLDREDNLFYKARFRLLLRVCACLLMVIFALAILFLVHLNYGHRVSSMAIRESGENASGLRGETGDNHRSGKPDAFADSHTSGENLRKNKLSYSYMVIGNSNHLSSGTSLKLQEEPERQAVSLCSLPSIVFQSPEPATLFFRLGKNDLPADLTNDFKKTFRFR